MGGVRRKIGKAKKKQASEAPVVAAANVKKHSTSELRSGPRERRAAAAAAATSASRVSQNSAGSLASAMLPRRKMDGQRMIDEIDEAIEHADRVAEIAASMGGRGRGSGRGKGNRKSRPSRQSRAVLAAFSAASEKPSM